MQRREDPPGLQIPLSENTMIRKKLKQFFGQKVLLPLWEQGPLLVGVSGGADSVALLRLLHEQSAVLRFQLIVVHYDHALRENSAEDADWVRELSRSLQLPCRIDRRDESLLTGKQASEEDARRWRYQFFAQTCEQTGACGIALAHNADDQAETVLHHIIRGSGLKGLQGIPAIRPLSFSTESNGPLLLRPLLQVSRSEIETYLQSISQPFRTDFTNTQEEFTRNQLRHTILPMLRNILNPHVSQALLQLSQVARDAQEIIEQAADSLLSAAILDRQPDSVRLNRSVLVSQPPSLLRALFLRLWEVQEWPRQQLGFTHLVRLTDQVLTQPPSRMSFPAGIEVTCRPSIVEFRRLLR